MLHTVFSEAGRPLVEHGPRNSEHPEFPPSSSTKDRQKKLPSPRSWRGFAAAPSGKMKRIRGRHGAGGV